MRLIDVDEAIINFGFEWDDIGPSRGEVVEFLRKQPTIDAVPVVRCWECKHRYTENCLMYFHDSYWHEGYEEYVDDYTDHTEDDYFCPKGERKEGADNEP